MAKIPSLRLSAGSTVQWNQPLAWAAALAAAIALIPLALTPGLHAVPPVPPFLATLLGPSDTGSPLVQRPADGVRVEITTAGYTVEHNGTSVALAAEERGASPWQSFAGGVSRETPFGLETIAVEPDKTEQYLTVTERQGPKTWRWKLTSGSLAPRIEDGAVFFFAGAQPADLRIAPAEILDVRGNEITPRGLGWTLARDRGVWWLELGLDDAGLPLPYVIDPAVDYPSPLFLSNSASTVMGSWNLVGRTPLLGDATTRASLCQNCAGYVLWQPGVDNGVAGTPSSTPTGQGWIADTAGATGFPAGSWSFTVETDIPDLLLAPGQAILAVGVWKGTVSGGAFSPTQTLLAPTDDPAAQDLRTSVLPVTTTATYSLPQFSLAAGETLYVEYWRKQVVGINDANLTRRYLDLIVNDGVAKIAHPAADDAPPDAPAQSISESSAASFVNGSTLYYRPNGGLGGPTFTIASSTSDSGSGVERVTFPGLAGGMTPTTATDDTTSPYSQTYSWSFGATESGTKIVTAHDNAGNSSTGAFTIVPDSAGPIGHSATLSGGPVYTTPSVPLILSNGTDGGGSGVNAASGSLGRDSAPLVGGACGSFSGTWFGIALTGGADTGVKPGTCYRYRYMVTDNVGNNSAWSTPSADAVVVNTGVGFHSSSSAGTVGTSLTLNHPAGTVVNDLLLAQVTVRSTSIAITEPTGWTFVRRDNTGSGANQLGQAIYYKFAGPSEPASYTWTFSGSIDASGGILAEAGVSPTSPIDVSGGLGGSGTSVTAPSVTTTSSGDRLVAFFGVGASTAHTPPAGMTEHYDAGGGQTAVSAADENQPLAGASGTRTATAISAASSSPNIGQLVALRKDATPPVSPTISLSESAADAFASGSTLFYRPAGAGNFTVNASASDGESGLQAIVLPGLAAGFTPTVAAAATARTYSWTSGASDAGAKTVTAYDNAGNTSTATFTLTPDSTPPTGGSVTYPDGPDADGVVTIATTDGSDAGAGLATGSGVLERQTATFASATCGAFGSWLPATSPDVVPPATCARYRYRISDRVGNEAVYMSINVVTVAVTGDLTPPTAPVLTLAESEPNEHVAGSTLFYNPGAGNSGSFTIGAVTSDIESGIGRVDFPAVFGLDGGSDDAAPYEATYLWSSLSTASGAHAVTVVNGAGLTSASDFTVTPDTAGPTVSLSAPAAGAAIGNGADISADASDALAGVALVEFGYCPGAVCSWLIATPIGTDATAPYSVTWNGQPDDGEYTLLAAATDHVGNGAASLPVTVTVDNTAASVSLAVEEGNRADLQYFDAATTTLYYNPVADGGFRLGADPSDATGVQVVDFPSVSSTGFTGAAASDALAPYESNAYSFNATNVAAPAPAAVLVTDLAGNTASASLSFMRDTDPPSGGDVSYAEGYDADGSVVIATTDGTDTASGVDPDSRLLERQTAPLADGSCGLFGGWTSVGSPDTVLSGSCARYRHTIADRVGNAVTVTSSNVVKVDLSAPLAPVLTLSESEPDEHVDGTTLYYNPSGANTGTFSVAAATSDSESTVAAVSFAAVFGLDGTTVTAAPYEIAYSWTASATASGTTAVTATNAAGLTASTSFTVTPDTAGPDVSLSAPADGAAVREGQAIEAAAFDTLAGTAEVEFGYCPGTDCTWSVATQLGADAAPPYSLTWSAQPADGTHTLIARAVDYVGNQVEAPPITVAVDNTAPSSFVVPSETFSPDLQHFEDATDTLYYNPEAGGGFVLSSAADDAGSGVARVDFPRISITGFKGAAASDGIAPFTSNIYSFDDANAVAPSDATIVVTDVAGNGATETISFARDTAAPTGGFVSYTGGYHPTGSVSIEAGSGTDAGVGIDGGSAVLERQTAVLEGGACGAYGAWAPTVSPDSLADAACGRYRHRVSDQVGNEALYTSTDIVKTDFTPPTAALVDPGAVLRGTVDLAADASDGASGIASLTYELSLAGAGQWADIPAGWDTTGVADGLYDLRVVATDQAGNSTASAALEARRVDNTAPGVEVTEPTGYVNAGSGDPVAVTAASPDSDVASIEFFHCSDASADCATGGWLSLGVDVSAPFVASWILDLDGNRALKSIAVDAVGNATSNVVNVTIDRQAPTNGSLSPSHAVNTWSSDNTVDVAFEGPSDTVSGVDGFSYQWDTDPAAIPDAVKDAEETAGGTSSPPLADGAWYFHLRTMDYAGNWSDTVHAGPFLVDANASTAVAMGGSTLLRPFNLRRTFAVSWSGSDGASGPSSYDIQYRTAAYTGAFGEPLLWQSATTATSASFTSSPGSTYCFSARALDTAGNLSPWSAERCTALPLNNTSLASSTGWSKRTGRGHYMTSYSVSSRRGASLARAGVVTRRIAVVVTKCAACGTLGVYWNGTLLRKLNLAASSTRKKQLITVAGFAFSRSGTVKLVVLSSGKPVIVEGLGVSLS